MSGSARFNIVTADLGADNGGVIVDVYWPVVLCREVLIHSGLVVKYITPTSRLTHRGPPTLNIFIHPHHFSPMTIVTLNLPLSRYLILA